MNKRRWCGAQLHSAVISIKHPTLRDLVGGQTAKLGNFDSCFSWAAEGSASAQIQKECCHPSRFARWHYRGLVPVTHKFSHITAIINTFNTWCGVCRKRLCNYCQLGLLRTMWWVSSRRRLCSALKQRDAVGTSDLAQVNNTWFVKFNVDDGAQDVVLWLRSQTFKVSCWDGCEESLIV